jgi:hypothetical protein
VSAPAYEFQVLSPGQVDAIRSLQSFIGAANAEKGFHDRTRLILGVSEETNSPGVEAALVDHVVATAALIDTESSELIEEVRAGRGLNEIYYRYDNGDPDAPATTPTGAPRKPEGVPTELADIEIRGFDFAARFGIDLAIEIDRKLAFNATRGHMHGKKL